MDAKLEQAIKSVAQAAARKRWNMPTWSGFDITIKRVEQVDDNTWNAVYDEPDTGTEEDMTVERAGDTLEASYTDDVLARIQFPESEQDMKREDLREGMRVSKYDPTLGWVPGTMRKTSHAGQESLSFVADGGQYAPSPTWPDSRFRALNEQEEDQELVEGTATTESGDVQLAPPGETPWNHSISLHQGRLALYWEVRPAPDRVETRIRMFTRDETEVLMTYLADNRYHIYHPGEGDQA